MTYSIELHYDSNIAQDHQIKLLDISNALQNLQMAITRAYLYNKYGTVWKYARTSKVSLIESAFLVNLDSISEGGFRFKVNGIAEIHRTIVDVMSRSLDHAWEYIMQEGVNYSFNLSRDYEAYIMGIDTNNIIPMNYEQFLNTPVQNIERNYGERSVSKEFSQIIRPSRQGEGTLELIMVGTDTKNYLFDQEKSKKFHDLVKQKKLGPPVNYQVRVTRLDLDHKTAIAANIHSNKKCTIYFNSDAEFFQIRDAFAPDIILHFIGCPIIEYGSYDPNRGDLYYLRQIVDENEAG